MDIHSDINANPMETEQRPMLTMAQAFVGKKLGKKWKKKTKKTDSTVEAASAGVTPATEAAVVEAASADGTPATEAAVIEAAAVDVVVDVDVDAATSEPPTEAATSEPPTSEPPAGQKAPDAS